MLCSDPLLVRSVRVLVMALVVAGAISAHAASAPDIPARTEIHVRMIDALNSGRATPGDMFHGTLAEPIVVSGKQLFPKGADVTGTVAAVHASGRLTDPGELSLILNTISSGGVASSVTVQPLQIKGQSHAKSNATKAGGGAALGAIIGGIAGGGKGAAIGAGVGAAAGTGAAAATGKKEAVVDSEAVLNFVTTENSSALSTTPANNPPAPTAVPETVAAPPAPASAQREPESNSASGDRSFENAVLFTARDRRVIRNCLGQHASELPPGTMQREELPSGAERNVRVGGSLSSELQKKAEPLPLACESELPRLPNDQERVVYSGRVLLIDESSRILDMFDLTENN
jgi:outer membrane lipoprotein SlyB